MDGLGVSFAPYSSRRNAGDESFVLGSPDSPFTGEMKRVRTAETTGRWSEVFSSGPGEVQHPQTTSFKVFPPAVEFRNVVPGPVYVMSLYIQNISTASQRIQFKGLSSRAFNLRDLPPGAVAPGLDTVVEIEFQVAESSSAEAPRAYHDRLIVSSDTETIEIPLRAYAPAPMLEFDGFLNLGTVVLGDTVAKYVDIVNVGRREGRVSITWDADAPVTISPAEFVLAGTEDDDDAMAGGGSAAPSSRRVKVEVQGNDMGAMRLLAAVQLDGEQSTRMIDINANVVEQRLEMMLPGRPGVPLTELPFGSVHYGERRTLKVLMVNNGPQPQPFVFDVNEREEEVMPAAAAGVDGAPLAPHEIGLAARARAAAGLPFRIEPAEGNLAPYEQLAVLITFCPRAPGPIGAPITGDGRSFDFFANVRQAGGPTTVLAGGSADADDEDEEGAGAGLFLLQLALVGRAVAPKIELSHRSFDFGLCPANDRRDILVTLRNASGEMPVTFASNRVAHFSVAPASGRLQPMQSMDLVVSFRPNQLGKFNNTLHLVVNQGVLTMPLRVSGVCDDVGERKTLHGGTAMLPENFKIKPKFVVATPTVGFGAKSSWVRSMPWQSHEVGLDDAEMAALAALPEFARTAVQTFTVNELGERHEHKQSYHAFLKSSRRARIQKKRAGIARRSGVRTIAEGRSEGGTEGGTGDTDEEGDPLTLSVGGLLEIGLASRDGLKAPREELPPAPDALWLERPPIALRSADEDLVSRAQEAVEAAKSGANAVASALAAAKSRRKRFKPVPSTNAELKACEERLREIDLVGVVATPSIVSFGTVCVGSENVRSFSVSNNLAKPILVRLDVDSMVSEISTSQPPSQVIPPGQTATFDVLFTSSSAGLFRTNVGYIVNEAHHFRFCADAEVMLPLLELSAPRLNFDFGAGDLAPTLSRTVFITNPGNATVNFEWTSVEKTRPLGSESAAFSVVPKIGRVDAFGKERIEVKFTPSYAVLSSVKSARTEPGSLAESTEGGDDAPRRVVELVEHLLLSVKGGEVVPLLCAADAEVPKCKFMQSVLDFGTMPVGSPQEVRLQLRNVGSSAVVFDIQIGAIDADSGKALADHQHGIMVEPKTGRVEAGQSCEFTCTLNANGVIRFDPESSFLTATVRGGRSQVVPISAAAVIPDVLVKQGEIDFGVVPIGATSRLPVAIHNRGAVPAQLLLDLRTAELARFSMRVPLAHGQDSAQAAASQFIDLDELALRSNEAELSPDASEAAAESSGRRWFINVAPNSELTFELSFEPIELASHAFELPLVVCGEDGRRAAFTDVGVIARPVGLRRVVAAQSAIPRLRLSPPTLNFGRVIVSRDHLRQLPTHQHIAITNVDASGKALNWVVSPSMDATGAFMVDPTHGALEHGESATIRVRFRPLGSSRFEAALPIFLDVDVETSKPNGPHYMELLLSGVGQFPRLNVDVPDAIASLPHLALPPVPLGIGASASFDVLNDGYEELELTCRLPSDVVVAKAVDGGKSKKQDAGGPIAVRFPEGKRLTTSKPALPVVMNFSSRQPLSFASRLDMLDAEGNRFGVPISGITDNSILTLWPFLLANRHMKIEAAAGSAPMLRTDATGAANPQEVAIAGGGGSIEYPATIGGGLSPVDATTLSTLLRWMNATVMKTPLVQFSDIAANEGQPLIECIEALYGRKLKPANAKGKGKGKSASKRTAQSDEGGSASGDASSASDKVERRVQQMRDLLSCLQSHGALLRQVQPEALLKKGDEFARYAATRLKESLSSDPDGEDQETIRRHRVLENMFAEVSTAAWFAVALQAIKVFVLRRVTPQLYANMPGVLTAAAVRAGTAAAAAKNAKSGGKHKGKGKGAAAKRKAGGKKEPNATSERQSQISELASALERDSSLMRSNVYTVGECLLLKWATLHHERCGGTKRIVTFDDDLRDGVVLCQLVLSHAPWLGERGRVLAGVADASSPRKSDAHGSKSRKSADACREMVNRFRAAMEELQLSYIPTTEDIIAPSGPLGGVLLLMYLFEQLPQLIPQTSISFHGVLGDTIAKQVNLRNAGKRSIVYSVDLTVATPKAKSARVASRRSQRAGGAAGGAPKTPAAPSAPLFTAGTRSVRVPAHGSAALALKFEGRFSKSAAARLTLRSRRGDATGALGLGATAMVFSLKSAVRGSRALATTQTSSTLYAPKRVTLELSNPFSERANVVLQLKETFKATGSDSSVNGSTFPAFWCEQADSGNTLSIEPKQSTTVEFTFLPFAMGSYCCTVLLLDETVGEFVYELRGDAAMPLTTASLECRVADQPSVTQQLRVPSRNTLMCGAVDVAIARIARACAGSSAVSQLQDRAYIAFGKMGLGPRAKGASAPFTVSVNSPFWRVPSTAALPPDSASTSSSVTPASRPMSGGSAKPKVSAKSGGKKESAAASSGGGAGEGRHKASIQDESSAPSKQDNCGALVPVMLSTKGAGEYPCSITVQRGADVRVYDIIATVPSTGTKSELRFRVPARSAITQEIPITNMTSEAWSMRCTLSGGNGAFSGPSNVQVKASSAASYSLVFSPAWLCEVRATLHIENQNTGDTMEFDLIGIGEDPLAEDHVAIECQARQRMTRTFVIKSDSTRAGEVEELHVESDLAEALTISGPSLVTVDAGGSSEYLLTLQPLLGGTYTGSISFVNRATGRYRWFTLEVNATSPVPEDVLDIETCVFFSIRPHRSAARSMRASPSTHSLFVAPNTLSPPPAPLFSVPFAKQSPSRLA
jgi:hypothetical protein